VTFAAEFIELTYTKEMWRGHGRKALYTYPELICRNLRRIRRDYPSPLGIRVLRLTGGLIANSLRQIMQLSELESYFCVRMATSKSNSTYVRDPYPFSLPQRPNACWRLVCLTQPFFSWDTDSEMQALPVPIHSVPSAQFES
jgi:hypothetical protein